MTLVFIKNRNKTYKNRSNIIFFSIIKGMKLIDFLL